jgi:hypothetical protein
MRKKRDINSDNSHSFNDKKHSHRTLSRKTGIYMIAILFVIFAVGIRASNQHEGKVIEENQIVETIDNESTETESIDAESIDIDKESIDTNVVETQDEDNMEIKVAQTQEEDNLESNAVKTEEEDNLESNTVETKDEDYIETIDTETLEDVFVTSGTDERIPVKVKGIYVTGPRAGSDDMEDLIELVDTTELNAMVIDIKNDSGEITYDMDLDAVQEIDADVHYISDMKKLVSELKDKDIYLIARIVAFKDPILAESNPDLCLKNADGTSFHDKAGLSWVNPYKKEVWDYLLSIAKEAVELGFDEIQFDYIRFSTDKLMNKVDFGEEAKEMSKTKVITEFTKYVSERLKAMGAFVSADVYGAVINSKVDSKIVGQNYVQMSKYLDYICPMIYPSHYAEGSYGIQYPDLEPYNLIYSALDKSKAVLEKIDEDSNKAIVRSWLQDFTATWIDHHKTYGKEEIRDQIQAIYDSGYEEWILWNGSNIYTKEGLLEK